MSKTTIFYILFCLISLLGNVDLKAQSLDDEPSMSPEITFTSIKDDYSREDVCMSPGEKQSTQAPVELTLDANIKNSFDSGYNLKSVLWSIKSNKGMDITRYDERTQITLTEAASYTISCKGYFVNKDDEDDVISFDEFDVFTVTIGESDLKFPDGFSPNGDHVNDRFGAMVMKSIVSLSGYIFNRWGQKLFTFTLENAMVHDDNGGWDGRYRGEYVKDGAYLLNVTAKGSEGREYNIKKAINVLKGYNENVDTNNTNQ